MNSVTTTFTLNDLGSQILWGSWTPDQEVVKARVTVFTDGLPFGIAALDQKLAGGSDLGTWVLTEEDKVALLDSMHQGIVLTAEQSGFDPDTVVMAVGEHYNTTPTRAAVDGQVVEQVEIPFTITGAGVVSPLASACVVSIRNLGTGLSYNDTEVPAGESFTLDLPAGSYRGVLFPRNRAYSMTQVTFEID
jgi:hypothetical protein